MPTGVKPSLYGISNSNRDFSDSYYWGKNQFNSSFPVALACFMRDQKIDAEYIRLDKSLNVFHEPINISEIFGSELPNNKLYFSFESRFDPYKYLVHDDLVAIDLVVKNAETDEFIRPIEIKLTTLPDNSTESFPEDQYGSEIVVRSPTMRYMALSMAHTLRGKVKKIHKIFEPSCYRVHNWDNAVEVNKMLPGIIKSINEFVSEYRSFERPLLMQPVWKTIGKSPQLADNCLDIFVWSDYALTRLFMDSASGDDPNKISRHERAAIRLARFLFEVSSGNKVYQAPIYDSMNYGYQNDKEFAVSGNKTNKYMRCPRLVKPVVHKSKIKGIILGGGQKWLSPERRFDAILYFSKDLFDE